MPEHKNLSLNLSTISPFLGFVAALIIFRTIALLFSPLNLGPDEAQYWRWSTEISWGYYSKPPLIAWTIAFATNIFGDAEWAIRLPAPLLHGLSACFIFALGEKMFEAKTGTLAATYYLLMPGITFSSGIMTTDAILLPCFAFFMLALWNLRSSPQSYSSATLLGIALGLGILAKYAMVYALVCTALAAIIDPATRRAVASSRGALAAGIALLIIIPHLIWNLRNGFQTINHTADNAQWSGDLFSLENGLQFLFDQMAVVGPFGFIVLMIAITTFVGPKWAGVRRTNLRWLLCFTLPILVLITSQAFISRAHANWAATAYVAGSLIIVALLQAGRPTPKALWISGAIFIILAAMWVPDLSLVEKSFMGGIFAVALLSAGALSGWTSGGILWGSFGLHAVLALVLTALALGPVQWSERMGFEQSFQLSRAWPQTVAKIADAATDISADVVLVDERELWHSIDYYGRRNFPADIYSWRRAGSPKSFAEQRDLADLKAPRVLVASIKPHQRERLRADFDEFDFIREIQIPLGGNEVRSISLFQARTFRPQPRDQEWEKRYDIEQPQMLPNMN
ncbi:MAG: glycosyltransferase family 39 protein [Pseudomonadota bacterium]